MTLTMSSSSRYRDIMTVNQWLETQESWLEALLQGEKRVDVGTKRKTFFKSVCNNFWLKEDEMIDFIL